MFIGRFKYKIEPRRENFRHLRKQRLSKAEYVVIRQSFEATQNTSTLENREQAKNAAITLDKTRFSTELEYGDRNYPTQRSIQ
jgi:hypothetical protein